MEVPDKTLLINIIREASHPLDPIPTPLAPRVGPLKDIRGVVFDVYGTLIISGAGDISLASDQKHDQPFLEAIRQSGLALEGTSSGLASVFLDLIQRYQELEMEKKPSLKHPEVDIREVWESFLNILLRENRLRGNLIPGRIDAIAVRYEMAVNPVFPMPGLENVLQFLRERQIPAGIISNAQFFTPYLFDALLGKSLKELALDSSISAWSYEEREAKPSTGLYRIAAERWKARYQISPENLLYVGNDMRNDIWPAHKIGFKTALFAGDNRSLRLREEIPECRSLKPDCILTKLEQIMEVLP